MLPSGTPSLPNWLTDRVQGNTHSTSRKLELLHTDFEAVHGGFVICLLLCVVSCGVFDMLGESSLGLLHPFIDVADSDVEVVKPLSEVAIASG